MSEYNVPVSINGEIFVTPKLSREDDNPKRIVEPNEVVFGKICGDNDESPYI